MSGKIINNIIITVCETKKKKKIKGKRTRTFFGKCKTPTDCRDVKDCFIELRKRITRYDKAGGVKLDQVFVLHFFNEQ